MNKIFLFLAFFLQFSSGAFAQDMFKNTEPNATTSSFTESKKAITYLKKSTVVAFEPNDSKDSWVMFRGNIDDKNLQFHASRVRISSKKVVGLFKHRTENCNWSIHFLNTGENATVLGNKKIVSKDGQSSAFGEIWYKQIYTNIDARFYSGKDGVRYNMIVKPTADADQIVIKWQGVEQLNIEKGNILEYKAADGTKFKGEIRAYQLIDGEEIAVEMTSYVNKNILRFKPSYYNREYPLVIDTPILIATGK